MNRFYTLFLTLLITLAATAQSTDWTGGAHDGSWTNPLNWSAGIPNASTSVRFTTGSSFVVSNVANGTIGGLLIGKNTNVTFLRSTAGVLTVANTNGGNGANFSIDDTEGAALTLGNNVTLQLSPYATAFIEGDLILKAGSVFNTDALNNVTVVKGSIINEGIIGSTKAQLVFLSKSNYEHARSAGSIPVATWEFTSNCIVTGVTSSVPAGLNQVFGNYRWNCALQNTGLANAVPMDIRGNLIVEKVGPATMDNIFIQFAAGDTRVDGTFQIMDGVIGVTGVSATVKLSKDFDMSGGALRAVANNENANLNIVFAGTQVQRFLKTGGVIERKNVNSKLATNNFIVADRAVVDFGSYVFNGTANFAVENGAGIMIGHEQGISATGATGNIQVAGTRTFSAGATYNYNGSKQQVSGQGLPQSVSRLIISNKSGVDVDGGVKLSRSVSVTNELVLQSGFLETSLQALLIVNDGAAASNVGNNSFVAGPMRKIGNSAFSFPVGWAGPTGGCVAIEMSSLNVSSTIQAEYKRGTAINVGSKINTPLHHVSYCEYWELFSVTGAPTTQVTLHWNTHSSCNPVSYISSLANLRVAQFNAGAMKSWVDAGNTGGSFNDGMVNSNKNISLNATGGRYFTMASISNANSPLPVFFEDVIAYEKEGGVSIEWSNLTERDIAIYFVERSIDGVNYSVIGQHLPKSNRDEKASYLQRDESPVTGSNYYRIKVIERSSSKIIFSKILRVEIGSRRQLTLYPNPVVGKQFTLGLSGIRPGNYTLRVVNTLGQTVHSILLRSVGSSLTQPIVLPQTINAGVYHLVVSGEGVTDKRSFVVQ